MADVFQVAVGHNNAGGLVTLDPSPDTDGLQYPRAIDTPDGMGYFDGKPFMLLRFPSIMTASDWVTTLARFGLSSQATRSANVTLRAPGENKSTYANWNGIAKRSQRTPWEYCWYRTPEILVTRLEAL